MKLLTPKAAARMHQKVHKLEQMLELLGCENEEMAFEMLLKMTEERQNPEEKTFAFFDGDVLFDIGLFGNEFDLSDEETLRKVCQEIGVAGEQYVFHMLKQFYEEQNLKVISETAYEIKFESKEESSPRTVIVTYPNDKNYHQAGWDICVNDSLNNGKTDYIEIKTHTKKSYLRRQISMSNEQMKMAIAKKEHYHVIVVLYDYPNKKGEELTVYKAFLNYIQSGELKNIQQNYVFYV